MKTSVLVLIDIKSHTNSFRREKVNDVSKKLESITFGILLFLINLQFVKMFKYPGIQVPLFLLHNLMWGGTLTLTNPESRHTRQLDPFQWSKTLNED